MISVVRQLNHWRFRERLIRLAWGLGRWFAIVGSVLLFACLADWLIDRYGRYVLLKQTDIDKANDWFERYNTKAVLIGPKYLRKKSM